MVAECLGCYRLKKSKNHTTNCLSKGVCSNEVLGDDKVSDVLNEKESAIRKLLY